MWDQEASYEYYQHGPLARTTLGDQEVQGIDYVYTLQGWIKGVNSNGLDATKDPGKDGDGVSDNQLVARDVFGYSLHYYAGDYSPIVGGNNDFIANQGSSDLTNTSSDLYNGNIGRMVTTITDPNSRHILPLGNAYQYDQLNRLKQAKSFNNYDEGSNSWGSGGTTMYYNAFTYDANGNIETQIRQNDAGTTIDDLTYNYHDLAGKRLRNRLYGVNDPTLNGDFSDDIDNMVFDSAQSTINQNNNYMYDAEGRLVKDLQEEIDTIVWRVDGKVKFILRPASSAKKTVSFDYDAMGHRIAKHSYTSNNSYLLEKSTYYILDAQGKSQLWLVKTKQRQALVRKLQGTMSVYERVVDHTEESIAFFQAEKHIYGSSRLGMHNEPVPMLGSQNTTYTMEYVDHRIGERTYELSNHLGNVLSVISDKAIPHDDGGGNVDYWLADIRQSTDYSPFGVTLEDRNLMLVGAEKSRYGFQNQEMDDEIKLEGNSYDFGARMYDSRLGRWLTIDALSGKYPHLSPYNFVDNCPIKFLDPDGRDIIDFLKSMSNGYVVQSRVIQQSTVFMNWISQYANVSGLDDSGKLGITTSGARSQINLKFEVTNLTGAGATSILFKGKNLTACTEAELTGAKPEDFQLLIQLNSSVDNSSGGLKAGDKLLTIGHEALLHGETLSLLLLDFFNGTKDAAALLEGYKQDVDGGGELDHLKITPGTSTEYSSFIADVNQVLINNRNLDTPFPDLIPEEKGYPRANELNKTYGPTSPNRNFNNKAVNLSDDFRHEVDHEKNHSYNPDKRGFGGNFLKKP
ncbi:RHS repeat-associated core domain protein [Fluviicola taffensis DSM 16823]|uniref:RHS repeat-associated core domain protein n=2 Tax=Fluviicola TaxID=332102 RepID=F2IEX1_FLUTR|nr:RHS repeat-associated core domain protein [Fluviicola taffensis DSM 16823]